MCKEYYHGLSTAHFQRFYLDQIIKLLRGIYKKSPPNFYLEELLMTP